MKHLSGILILGWLTGGLAGCMSATPDELLGTWKIDKFTVDGMDRDRVAFNRSGLDDPIDWGSAIQFMADGTFRTNSGQQGRWKLSQSRAAVLLYTSESNQPIRWKAAVGETFLVLHTSTRKINLSRTEQLPTLPPPPPPNLRTNLPGTWYFYQWTDQHDTLHYPSNEKQAHWLTMDWQGVYQSGEGKHQSFEGRWQLQQDTLLLSESSRALRQSWHVRLSGDTLYVEPADDASDWFQALLVRKM